MTTLTRYGTPDANARSSAGPIVGRSRDQLAVAAEGAHHLVVAGLRREVGDDVVAVEEAHRVLLQSPPAVVAHHHDHRQAVPHEGVDVHQREAGRAVAEQQHHLAAGRASRAADRVAEPGAQAAVRAGVEPAAGCLRLDVLPGERHEVAAVADHDRVVGQPAGELAVDPRGVDRVGVAGEQSRGPCRPPRARLSCSRVGPAVVRRRAAGAPAHAFSTPSSTIERSPAADAGELDVLGQLAG